MPDGTQPPAIDTQDIVWRIWRDAPPAEVAKLLKKLIDEAAGRLVPLIDVPAFLTDLAGEYAAMEEDAESHAPSESYLRKWEGTVPL